MCSILKGYKPKIDTKREHMAQMGDWRNDKDKEIQLDGVGGVNIMVKADVHRSGKNYFIKLNICGTFFGYQLTCFRHQFPMLRL